MLNSFALSRFVVIPLFTVAFLAIALTAVFICLGFVKVFPVEFKIKDRIILLGLGGFILGGLGFSAFSVLANLTPLEQQCNVYYKVAVWAWAVMNGGLYAVLFEKSVIVRFSTQLTGIDKLILAVICAYPTVCGAIFSFAATGFFRDDDSGDRDVSVCIFSIFPALYVLAAVADSLFSSVLMYFFIQPLVGVVKFKRSHASGDSTKTTKLKSTILRNAISGCLAILSTLVLLVYGLIGEIFYAHSTRFRIGFIALGAFDLAVNTFVVIYSTIKAWRWRKTGECVFSDGK